MKFTRQEKKEKKNTLSRYMRISREYIRWNIIQPRFIPPRRKRGVSPAVESIVTREKSGIGSSPSLANRLTNHGYACWLLACHNARSCTLGQEWESVIPTPCYHSRHSFGRITDDSLLSKTRRQHGLQTCSGNTSNWISRVAPRILPWTNLGPADDFSVTGSLGG